MLVLLIIGIFLVALLLWMLFTPFRLEIDTDARLYRFSLVPFFRARYVTESSPPSVELRIFGIRRFLPLTPHPQEPGNAEPAVQTKKPVQPKKGGQRMKVTFNLIKALLRSFHIRRWFFTMDTGDVALNGRLYFWFYLFSIRTGRACSINFTGKNVLIVTIENNVFRVLKAFFTNK